MMRSEPGDEAAAAAAAEGAAAEGAETGGVTGGVAGGFLAAAAGFGFCAAVLNCRDASFCDAVDGAAAAEAAGVAAASAALPLRGAILTVLPHVNARIAVRPLRAEPTAQRSIPATSAATTLRLLTRAYCSDRDIAAGAREGQRRGQSVARDAKGGRAAALRGSDERRALVLDVSAGDPSEERCYTAHCSTPALLHPLRLPLTDVTVHCALDGNSEAALLSLSSALLADSELSETLINLSSARSHRAMVEVEELDSEEEQSHQPVRDRADSDSGSEHAHDGDASEAEAEAADAADDDASLPAAPSSLPPMGDQFQHLLQLASHLKSSQPEVREKRAQWDRLQFHQKNTVIWQKQDAAVRYDLATAINEETSAAAVNDASSAAASSSAASSVSSESCFDSVRFPLALHFKSLAGAAFARGTAAAAASSSSSSSSAAAAGAAAASAFQEASLSYQRAMGLFAWGRKSQTKDGDEIEWRDLTDPKAIEKETALATSTGRKKNEGTPEELEAAAASTEQFYLPAPILTPQQRQRAQQLLFTCLINVAACEEKLQQWSQVIAVCEAALAMDLTKQPASAAAAADGFNLSALTVKALFRAATAYTHLDDLERSLALLTRASKLSPKDATIAAELQRLRATLERQREKDKKHFGGFLQRKDGLTDSDAEEEAATARKQQRNNTAAAASSSAASSASTSASTSSAAASAPSSGVSMAAADQTKQFLSSYLAGFREQAAKDRAAGKLPPAAAATSKSKKADSDDDEVDGSIDTSSASARRSRVPVGPSASSNEDLASLYADALANFGLDLSDPLVQQELQRLQEEHKRTGKLARPPPEDDEPASASASAAASSSKARPPRELQKRHRDGALGPSDLASTEPTTWRGGFMLFCIILAAALRWMKIL